MRRGSEVEKRCVLAAAGVTEDRQRRVLTLQAGDRESAKAWAELFGDLIRRRLDPQAVQLGVMDGLPGLETDADSLVAFLQFPESEWMSPRTTNVVERLNKEFKRRTKPMEIVAGEASVYRILAFVAIKMESSWRKAQLRNSGFRKLEPFSGHFTHAGRHCPVSSGGVASWWFEPLAAAGSRSSCAIR